LDDGHGATSWRPRYSSVVSRRIRIVFPALYGLLVAVGFIVSAPLGVIVAVAGAMIVALLWTTLSG
jgi:hypothetical protein